MHWQSFSFSVDFSGIPSTAFFSSGLFEPIGEAENLGERGSLNTDLIDVIHSVLASSLSALASNTFVFPSFFVMIPMNIRRRFHGKSLGSKLDLRKRYPTQGITYQIYTSFLPFQASKTLVGTIPSPVGMTLVPSNPPS